MGWLHIDVSDGLRMSNLKLNIRRHCCLRLSVWGTITEPKATRDAIISFLAESKINSELPDRSDRTNAIFASKYQIDNESLIAIAIAEWAHDPKSGFTLRLVVQEENDNDEFNFPIPHRYIWSVSRLLSYGSDLFGPISGTCDARFLYRSDRGFRSKMELPSRLLTPDASAGFTHVEGIELSRRTGDEIEYSTVLMMEENHIAHGLQFPTEFELTRASMDSILRRAVDISSQLVTRETESTNDRDDQSTPNSADR